MKIVFKDSSNHAANVVWKTFMKGLQSSLHCTSIYRSWIGFQASFYCFDRAVMMIFWKQIFSFPWWSRWRYFLISNLWLFTIWRTQLWKISILWIGGEMYDDANKSHHDVADIKTFKVFFLSSQVKRLSNTFVKSTHCRWPVNAVVTARCPNPMERLRLVITMNGADGDQRAGHWLMMLRLMMIGIFPAIKMMMVFSEDVCDISVCLWDFSGGYQLYKPLSLLLFIRLFVFISYNF